MVLGAARGGTLKARSLPERIIYSLPESFNLTNQEGWGHLMVIATSSCARGLLGRPGVAISTIAFVLLTAGLAEADQIDRPKFRTGLWRFERTVEYVRRPPNVNLVLVKSDTTRCVDPNVAMTGIFASPSVGNCRSEKPQLFGNQYIFSNRCDFMGPVSTVITAESDVAYTEVNLQRRLRP